VVLDGAEHSGWSTAQEATVLTEMEQFLARHLPVPASPAPSAPDTAPPASAETPQPQTGQAGSAPTETVRAVPDSPS
jgi:hypothetical protein